MTYQTFILSSLRQYILLFVTIAPSLLFAQRSSSFRLVDNHSSQPIVGVTYEYGSQNGLSDHDGQIDFRLEQDQQMHFSHLAYGRWTLTEDELVKAIAQGHIRRNEIPVKIYPVSIIALRPKGDEVRSIGLDNLDRLAHDGGAVLSHMALINGIRKSGSYGLDPVMRGFKYDQVNIVMDGTQSAIAACPNRMDPPSSQMAPNMIEKVEIIKGPYALRYGNALGGTINFIPTDHEFSQVPTTYGRLSGTAESNKGIFRSEGLLGFRGTNHDLGVFAAWSQGNDYHDGSKNLVPADFARGSFGSRLGLKIKKNQTLTFQAIQNLARDVDFAALPMDLRKDKTLMFSARHHIQLDKSNLSSWQTSLYGTFVDHLMDNRLKMLSPRMMNAETNAITSSYGGRTEGKWRFDRGLMLAGLDLRIEEASGTRTREFLLGPNAGKTLHDNAWQESSISKTGIFGEFHQRIQGGLNLVFSGRLEINRAMANDRAPEFGDVHPDSDVTQFNPGLSVGAIKNLSNKVAVGLWLGRTQRSGSITERFINYFPVGQDPYEMLGNPQLKPEINNQIDLTFQHRTQKTIINLDLFAAFLEQYISSSIDPALSPRLPNSPGVRQFINLGQALNTGFEFSWKQQFSASLQQSLSLAYTHGQHLKNGKPLPEIAPLDIRYELSGNFLHEKLRPSIVLRHVVEQQRISKDFGETPTPGFTLVDVQTSYQIRKSLVAHAGIHNLFDITYYEHLSRSVRGAAARPLYATGRNMYISMTLDLR